MSVILTGEDAEKVLPTLNYGAPEPRINASSPSETHFFYLTVERKNLPDLINAIEIVSRPLHGIYNVTHRECDNQWSQDGSMVEYHIEISGPADYGCSKATQLLGGIFHQMEVIPLKRQIENTWAELSELKHLLAEMHQLQAFTNDHEWKLAFARCISVALRLRGITAEKTAAESGISKTTLYSVMDGENCNTESLFSLMNVLGVSVNFGFLDQESWDKRRV